MNAAWIIGEAGALAVVVDRALGALGFEPRRLSPTEPWPLNGSDPALIVIVGEPVQTSERLAADDTLAALPTLMACDEPSLAAETYGALSHELLIHPFSVAELTTRVLRAKRAAGVVDAGDSEVIVSGTLEINTATYQVRVDGQPIDFTYMEYELLKFFVTHPDRVFSRELLLGNVWGQDYFGGARTVDVHIRRVRAKLGQEHAERIRTLRSVGYRWDDQLHR